MQIILNVTGTLTGEVRATRLIKSNRLFYKAYRIFKVAEPTFVALDTIIERTPDFVEGSWRIYTRRLCLSRRQVRGTSDVNNIP